VEPFAFVTVEIGAEIVFTLTLGWPSALQLKPDVVTLALEGIWVVTAM
jgi:hypothetical protein